MKIYTKTGDEGKTSLIGGTRVSKADLRIETFGTVDELNAYVGLIASNDLAKPYQAVLREIQDRLFTVGASLASDPEKQAKKIPDLVPSDVTFLELEIDKMNESLPALRHFILPGGDTAASFCHVARCVCRRAERLVVDLSTKSVVDKLVMVYLNRLSDFLFILARKLSSDAKVAEFIWTPRI